MTPDCIEEMMGYLQRPDAGVVGAKLYFVDHLVQHAGIVVGVRGTLAHANQDFSARREGYLARAVRPGNFSAVTGACQMVRRDVYLLIYITIARYFYDKFVQAYINRYNPI